MSDPKYIINDYEAIIFPAFFDHQETARSLGFKKDEISGAGFVSFGDNGEFTCYGESVSLGIKSNGKEDNRFIDKLLRPDGF